MKQTLQTEECPELVPNLNRKKVKRMKVLSSSEAAEYAMELWEWIDIYESVIVLYLNRDNYTIGWYKASQGGLVGTVLDVRLVMKVALDNLATTMIVCHNHPSGSLRPSRADELVTKKLKEASSLFDIQLNDHLILTEDGYFSFADEGLL